MNCVFVNAGTAEEVGGFPAAGPITELRLGGDRDRNGHPTKVPAMANYLHCRVGPEANNAEIGAFEFAEYLYQWD